jgi:hypothetical protein
MGEDGRFVATWMDYRNGDADVYCRLFDSSGVPVDSARRVNDDPPGSFQGYPGCAVAPDGGFAVTWDDTRDPGADVYVQWFDSLGAMVGANEQVNDGASEAYSATCSFNPDGRLAVAFTVEPDTPGGSRLHCQRFRPDRSRISGNQPVADSASFPDNHQWTVGQSIAAGPDRVAFAWTDNRRHLGWDIYAKLTDWELVACGEPTAGRDAPPMLHPTVSRGRFRLVGSSAPTRILVRDVAGRTVRRFAESPGSRVIDLGGLPAGVYVVTADAGSGKLQQKVIVR